MSLYRGRPGRGRMVVEFTTNLDQGKVHNIIEKACQWLPTGQWFSSGTPVSSTKKTDRHDITETLFKVVLNTINLNQS